MHCPQCGQEQFSSEMRFCKSCGFSLDGVKHLLATAGASPVNEKENNQPRESPRRKGVRQGVILLFISMVFMPLITLIGKPRGDFLPMIFLMAGLMRILYAVIFQKGAPRKRKQDSALLDVSPITTDQLGTAARGSALPTSESVPVSGFSARGMDTSEMVSRASVTEHTTKLLEESQEPKADSS
jgi:hypothetical protein